jgi:hypothetical protein
MFRRKEISSIEQDGGPRVGSLGGGAWIPERQLEDGGEWAGGMGCPIHIQTMFDMANQVLCV